MVRHVRRVLGRTGRGAGRVLLLVALGAVLAVGASACGGSDEGTAQGGAGAPQETQKITIGGVFCTCHAGAYVAWQKGFFEKHGIEVEYVFTEGGSDSFSGLAGKQFDFAALTTELVVRGQAEGIDVKAVANLYPEFWALTVRNDLAGEITKVEDLEGRRVGVSKVGSGSWAFLVALAAKHGIDQKDIEILPLGKGSDIVAGLKAKQVDAAVTWEPGTSAAVLGEIGTPILDLQEPDQVEEVLGSDVSMSQVLAARSDLIEENPELVQDVVDALTEAYAWMKEHSADEMAAALAPVAGDLDEATLKRAVEATLKVQPDSPTLTEAGYKTSTELLIEAGALEEEVAFDEVVACDFAGCE